MPQPAHADDGIRPHSRRHAPRRYLVERISDEEQRALRAQLQPAGVFILRAAGKVGTALRRHLTELGIDPKIARLLLVLEGWKQVRVSDIAWQLNVSTTTASRHLDRAERAGLVDKLYSNFDRRGTWARLTGAGRELRAQVVEVMTTLDTDRPEGPAHGARSNRPHFSRNE
jgi:DNA-binding MarR family transcriptional regulator